MTEGTAQPLSLSSTTVPPLPVEPSVGKEPAPLASFIVCTRNRASALEACIRSIQAACRSHAAFKAELVVVDNGSTDDTSERLAQIARSSDIAIAFISEPKRGLAAARNAGLEKAQGRLLVFIDDDCEIHPAYLRDLAQHYDSGERCVIRGGRVELGNADDLPFTVKRSPSCERFGPSVHPGGFVLGCNMTMHREVATRVGRFDERFGAGSSLRSAEDTDYLVRAYLLGIPVEYVPNMTVFHHHGRKDRQSIEILHRNYSLGNGGLCLKHFRNAPWLLRHFCWTVRGACRELVGGPLFDSELRLSHWPIVVMNLRGAAKFAGLLMTRRPERTKARGVQQATAGLR
jgi:glycosyltransferase involved in cell wall biosynthesis